MLKRNNQFRYTLLTIPNLDRQMNKEAYIIDGIRMPIGRALSAVRADDLAALVIEELIKRKPFNPQRCDG
ncbi:hypothetical protein J2810_004251 [Chryseobacterium rhizosphaerae]|uniref:hypothetical protein n=1 Tax=Chryseobacterium rhizosphaerae TaxID=395937 RepID=UPI0028670354|nr:hypothetical protein [Chryseobacterium rhizosphaerae]MDR6548164.1 hypothetical protein [Chryseobacterium rhizosphaerae]